MNGRYVVALAIAAFVTQVQAQEANSGSTATSGSNANSGSVAVANPTTNVNPTFNTGSTSNSGSTSGSISGSSSSSSQGQTQGQQQANQQGQQQANRLNNQNNTTSNAQQGQAQDASNQNQIGQSITFNSPAQPNETTTNVNYSGTTTQKYAPALVAPVMNPTTPCLATVSAGASMIGFGITVGGGFEDKECTRREFARSLQAIGQNDAAMAVLCSNEMVKASAPRLCERIATVMAGGVDPGQVKAVSATTAPVPAAAAAAPKSTLDGRVERGSDGRSYRYTDRTGWQPISDVETMPEFVGPPRSQPMVTAEATTYPLRAQPVITADATPQKIVVFAAQRGQ